MPNTFAYLVLFSWPLVVFILFRKLPTPNALIWSIVAGYLLLPEQTGIDFPLFPAFDKELIPVVAAGIMCFIMTRQSRKMPSKLQPTHAEPFVVIRGQRLFWGLLSLLFLTPFMTAIQNPNPLIYGTRYLRGLEMYDVASMNLQLGVAILPFLLARRYLVSEQSHRLLLQVLVIAGLCYGFLALYEVRMSPQLNRMVYGFFPHSFAQHIRGGGFRPLVFLGHGLWLAIFFATSILASFSLWRSTPANSALLKWLLTGLWLMLVLFLSHSLGALLIVLFLTPAVIFLRVRSQLFLAVIIAGTVLLYPMLRGAGYIPINSAYNFAQSIDEERAQSLKFRFDNEDILLQKAKQKPLSGWGIWGRSLVFSETGKSISVPDGIWVIIIGTYGWLGYIAQFGLLCVPILMLGRHRKQLNTSRTTISLALVLGAMLIDLLLNATLTPITWLIAGAMMGHYQTEMGALPEGANSSEPQVRNRPTLLDTLPIEDKLPPRHQRQPRATKNTL